MVGDSEKLSSSSPLPKSYGITKPISLAGPTEADHLRNAELEKVFCLWNLCFICNFFQQFWLFVV